MAGAQDLLARLPKILGKDVRVIAAPCIGRCEQAPAVVVSQNPVPHATCEAIAAKDSDRAEAAMSSHLEQLMKAYWDQVGKLPRGKQFLDHPQAQQEAEI